MMVVNEALGLDEMDASGFEEESYERWWQTILMKFAEEEEQVSAEYYGVDTLPYGYQF